LPFKSQQDDIPVINMYKCGNKYYYKSMKIPKTLPPGAFWRLEGAKGITIPTAKDIAPTNNTIIFVFK